ASVVQYIRPEIIGFILGSFIAALMFREFKPRTGSAPIIRFLLGFFAMIGALIFLGCPWRAMLRLAGGDWNAIFGITGLVIGIVIGVFLLKNGFSLKRNHKASKIVGLIMPILALVLLSFAILKPVFSASGETGSAPIFFSIKGPGAMFAPLIISLIVGLLVGFLAQRSRFCTVGAIRDLVLLKDFHLFNGLIAFIVLAFITNLILAGVGDVSAGFNPGFEGQPAAHTDWFGNMGGMILAGLAFTMAGGCPGRQVFLSGEGDGDAGIFVLGMLVGAGFAHNFGLAASGKGLGTFSWHIVIIGVIFCLLVGFTMREKMK
ncbi:MAG: YedE-related selenium metabolism membrane protein, partial [Planctomycetes bacterium]|nr:YedE-related selenium metabolism membrane protein [Planctomycetota bacterium]